MSRFKTFAVSLFAVAMLFSTARPVVAAQYDCYGNPDYGFYAWEDPNVNCTTPLARCNSYCNLCFETNCEDVITCDSGQSMLALCEIP